MARILIVDDQDPILFGLHEYFRLRGHDVDAAHERDEALALLACRTYDLVITDLRLGEVNHAEGLDIIAEVKERYPGTRVLLLTAYGSAAVVAEARELGVDDVVQKPLPLDSLERIALGVMERAV
jgi:two-component system response regulator HydG